MSFAETGVLTLYYVVSASAVLQHSSSALSDCAAGRRRRRAYPRPSIRSLTVQLPLYNEPNVAMRLIERCRGSTIRRARHSGAGRRHG